jgi:hypothetical protein
MVEITVEILDILATATKEMKESRASQFFLSSNVSWGSHRFRKNCKEGSREDGPRGWAEEARDVDE